MDFILDRSNYTLPNYHQPVAKKPYPFQLKAFEALDNLKKTNPNGFASMLVLPTGAGKTFTAVHWVLKNYVNENVKVLWIAHRSELLRQAAETFFANTNPETLPDRSVFHSYVVSSEFGRSCNITKDKETMDVVIAGRQSVCSSTNLDYFVKWAKGKGLKKDRKLLIVLDEAHHAAARSYRTIIDTMRKYIPHVDILGLTATPFRTAKSEQGSLKKIFSTGSGIAYKIDMNTLFRCGILSQPKHIEVNTNVDMTKLFDGEEIMRVSRLDLTSLSEKSLEKLNKNTNRNQVIVDTYLENRDEFGRTIVFAVDVLNAIALNGIFKSQGVKSDFVVSAITDSSNRSDSSAYNSKVIRDFKAGKLEVLINVNIVTEGTDIPGINTVFLARPTTSKILMTQMVGRGLRGTIAGGTAETNLVYFIDDWKGLVDFVSPKELLDGEDIISVGSSDRKKVRKHYIELADIYEYAVSGYSRDLNSLLKYKNFIPYGVIRCEYMAEGEFGDDTEVKRDVVVFDDVVEVYEAIINEISQIFSCEKEYPERDVKIRASELFFKYCESGSGAYMGVSGESIEDVIRSYLATKEVPVINRIDDRVSLSDIMEEIYSSDVNEGEMQRRIIDVYNINKKVRSWFDKDEYIGLMNVLLNRKRPKAMNAPQFVLPPKERMDMAELKKYYPAYYNEIRNYLILNMKRDEEGYYYSAIQEEGKPPIRDKNLGAFEMDHIIPISRGGLTEKGNMQMITRVQNRKKGNKIEDTK